jgi:hypothetical protein
MTEFHVSRRHPTLESALDLILIIVDHVYELYKLYEFPFLKNY